MPLLQHFPAICSPEQCSTLLESLLLSESRAIIYMTAQPHLQHPWMACMLHLCLSLSIAEGAGSSCFEVPSTLLLSQRSWLARLLHLFFHSPYHCHLAVCSVCSAIFQTFRKMWIRRMVGDLASWPAYSLRQP
jgi:hypothetical protein